jgi:predicted PurR-regulated permease PerM
VAVILALLIGGKLAGIPGVIMAVPAAAVISVFVEDFLKKRTV